jgi:hypothetical protein
MEVRYSLRDADRSVKLAVVLFLAGVGVSYVFAFLMVRTYAGTTPASVAATYEAETPVSLASAPTESFSETHAIDLSTLGEGAHRVDTALLIQDSHVHLLLYAIVAALESLIVFGLGWPAWLRDLVITAAFLSGLTDFAGQWLIKFGWPAFSLLTIVSGWTMAGVYLAVCVGALTTLWPERPDKGRREV